MSNRKRALCCLFLKNTAMTVVIVEYTDTWLDGCCAGCAGCAVHRIRPLFQVPGRQVWRYPFEPQDADESGIILAVFPRATY